jgi:hypothetical protein
LREAHKDFEKVKEKLMAVEKENDKNLKEKMS